MGRSGSLLEISPPSGNSGKTLDNEDKAGVGDVAWFAPSANAVDDLARDGEAAAAHLDLARDVTGRRAGQVLGEDSLAGQSAGRDQSEAGVFAKMPTGAFSAPTSR